MSSFTWPFARISVLASVCVLRIASADDALDRVHVHHPTTNDSIELLRHDRGCIAIEALHLANRSEDRSDTRVLLQARTLGSGFVGGNGNQIEDCALISTVGGFQTTRLTEIDGIEELEDEPVVGAMLTHRKFKEPRSGGSFTEVRELVEIKLSNGRWRREGQGLKLEGITSVPRYGKSMEGAGVGLIDSFEGVRLLRSQVNGEWKALWNLKPSERVDVDKNSGELYVVRRGQNKIQLFRVRARGLLPIDIPKEVNKTGSVLLAGFDDKSKLTHLVLGVKNDATDDWSVVYWGKSASNWKAKTLLSGKDSFLLLSVGVQRLVTGEFLAAVWEKNMLKVSVLDQQRQVRSKTLKLKIPTLYRPETLHIVDDGTTVHVLPRSEVDAIL